MARLPPSQQDQQLIAAQRHRTAQVTVQADNGDSDSEMDQVTVPTAGGFNLGFSSNFNPGAIFGMSGMGVGLGMGMAMANLGGGSMMNQMQQQMMQQQMMQQMTLQQQMLLQQQQRSSGAGGGRGNGGGRRNSRGGGNGLGGGMNGAAFNYY